MKICMAQKLLSCKKKKIGTNFNLLFFPKFIADCKIDCFSVKRTRP